MPTSDYIKLEQRLVLAAWAYHNIGYPQLFTVLERSAQQSSAKRTVNNCAGAGALEQDSDRFCHALCYRFLRFSRLGGPGLRTTSRFKRL